MDSPEPGAPDHPMSPATPAKALVHPLTGRLTAAGVLSWNQLTPEQRSNHLSSMSYSPPMAQAISQPVKRSNSNTSKSSTNSKTAKESSRSTKSKKSNEPIAAIVLPGPPIKQSIKQSDSQTGYFKIITPSKIHTSTEPRIQLGRQHQLFPPTNRTFVSLGESRELSRHHVTIEPTNIQSINQSNKQTNKQYQLVIVGRNSVLVDGKLYKKRTQVDIIVNLAVDRATPIKTGDVKWWFCPPDQ